MSTPVIKEEKHFLYFPYSQILFGKNFKVVGLAEFSLQENKDEVNFTVDTLTGTDDAGNILDMTFLLEDERLVDTLVSSIEGNRENWSIKPKNENDTYWWGFY